MTTSKREKKIRKTARDCKKQPKRIRPLKLYVWEDVLCNYTCGMACVLAHNKTEAIKLVAEKYSDEPGSLNELKGLEPKVITKPEAFLVHGEGYIIE